MIHSFIDINTMVRDENMMNLILILIMVKITRKDKGLLDTILGKQLLIIIKGPNIVHSYVKIGLLHQIKMLLG